MSKQSDKAFYEFMRFGLSEEQDAQFKADAIRFHALGYSWEEAGCIAISRREEISTLQYLTEQGIALIGAYDSGASINTSPGDYLGQYTYSI